MFEPNHTLGNPFRLKGPGVRFDTPGPLGDTLPGRCGDCLARKRRSSPTSVLRVLDDSHNDCDSPSDNWSKHEKYSPSYIRLYNLYLFILQPSYIHPVRHPETVDSWSDATTATASPSHLPAQLPGLDTPRPFTRRNQNEKAPSDQPPRQVERPGSRGNLERCLRVSSG